jgi:hypothetical protein
MSSLGVAGRQLFSAGAAGQILRIQILKLLYNFFSKLTNYCRTTKRPAIDRRDSLQKHEQPVISAWGTLRFPENVSPMLYVFRIIITELHGMPVVQSGFLVRGVTPAVRWAGMLSRPTPE